jgi:hypothetical protein
MAMEMDMETAAAETMGMVETAEMETTVTEAAEMA